MHSTGVAAAFKGKKRHIEYLVDKEVTDPFDFLFTPEVVKELEGASCVIGHCRHATVGKINTDNAHPYEFEHIIGAHNGTVMSLQNEADRKGTTDSYLLYKMLNDEGIDETIKRVGSGAYALTWFDKRDNTLNLLRNDQRPLFLMTAPGTVYWASEADFLNLVGSRSTLKVEKPCIIPANTLHTIDLTNMSTTTREVKYTPPPIVPNLMSCMKKFKGNSGVIPFKPDVVKTPNNATPSVPIITKPQAPAISPLITEGMPDISKMHFKLENGVTAASIDPAEKFFPRHVGAYPFHITMSDGSKKYLRYEHPRGIFLMPKDMQQYMTDGCLCSKRQATMTTPMWWINNDEWVTGFYKEDAFIMEYFTSFENELKGHDSPVLGRWVYGTLNGFNLRLAVMKRAANAETISELHRTIN